MSSPPSRFSEEGSLSTRGPGSLLPEGDHDAPVLRAYTLPSQGTRNAGEPPPEPLSLEHLGQRARWIPPEALEPSRDPSIWIG